MDDAYTAWLDRMEAGGKKVLAIECGAGLTIPSARCEAEDIAERFGTTLVRIDPIEDMAPISSPVGVGIPLGSTDDRAESRSGFKGSARKRLSRRCQRH